MALNVKAEASRIASSQLTRDHDIEGLLLLTSIERLPACVGEWLP